MAQPRRHRQPTHPRLDAVGGVGMAQAVDRDVGAEATVGFDAGEVADDVVRIEGSAGVSAEEETGIGLSEAYRRLARDPKVDQDLLGFVVNLYGSPPGRTFWYPDEGTRLAVFLMLDKLYRLAYGEKPVVQVEVDPAQS